MTCIYIIIVIDLHMHSLLILYSYTYGLKSTTIIIKNRWYDQFSKIIMFFKYNSRMEVTIVTRTKQHFKNEQRCRNAAEKNNNFIILQVE